MRGVNEPAYIDGPDERLLDLLDRLRDADATVDDIPLPDGTSRLLITVPFFQGLGGRAEGEAA